MHVFVEAARRTLQNLWDDLFYSEEQMAEFTPAFTGNPVSLKALLKGSRHFYGCIVSGTRIRG
jgi:hypothetical protein